MLIQKVDTLCEIVLRTGIVRLNYITSHIDDFYKEYHKYKLDKFGNKRLNKPKYREKLGLYWCRTISSPNKELKTLQQRTNKYITSNTQLPSYAYGGVKGKDNIINARRHKGQKYVFQTDLKDFYPFITCHMVYDMLVCIGFSHDVARMLTKLTTYNGHLPQGAPTSSIIANLVFEPTGNKLLRLAGTNNLRFTTFVDDVTMSSQTDFKNLTPQIIQILREDGFRISQNKTTYKSGIKEITGVKMLNNAMTTTDKFNNKYANIDELPEEQATGARQYKARIKMMSQKK